MYVYLNMYKYEVFGEDHVDDVLSKVTEWEIYLDINICNEMRFIMRYHIGLTVIVTSDYKNSSHEY